VYSLSRTKVNEHVVQDIANVLSVSYYYCLHIPNLKLALYISVELYGSCMVVWLYGYSCMATLVLI